MTVSAETYIVISLMFAVFAAVAAVGTSVVLGAGFERLRAGFEVVRRQSGFFADAIYKLDQRTQKLDEETMKLKIGLDGMGDRMERAEKTATFFANSLTSIEHRILQGSPLQDTQVESSVIEPVTKSQQKPVSVELGQWTRISAQEQTLAQPQPETAQFERHEDVQQGIMEEAHGSSRGLTTLLTRYFKGETSGNGKSVVYH